MVLSDKNIYKMSKSVFYKCRNLYQGVVCEAQQGREGPLSSGSRMGGAGEEGTLGLASPRASSGTVMVVVSPAAS